jgi:hypothetical protein
LEKKQIEELVIGRHNPIDSPISPIAFISCTGDDAQVEWMKELEEKAKFCSEYDDYDDEKREVLGDQGEAMPYTIFMWSRERMKNDHYEKML